MTCPSDSEWFWCGAALAAPAGADLPEVHCPACGLVAVAGARYCIACGGELPSAADVAAAAVWRAAHTGGDDQR